MFESALTGPAAPEACLFGDTRSVWQGFFLQVYVPSPKASSRGNAAADNAMGKRSSNPALITAAILACSGVFFAGSTNAQISKVSNNDGRMFFVNADPPA